MREIKSTGERLETFVENENTLEHLHRYAIAKKFTAGKIVLDLASGEGYGSALLASNALKVLGVDISDETVNAAVIKYKSNNLAFEQGSADKIPAEDNFFDVVVSFETIEHHPYHDEMMQEIKRVLKKDGLLIISTPDKYFYSDMSNYKNPFHVKELYLKDFQALINKYFGFSNYFVQKCILNSIVWPLNGANGAFEEYTGDYTCLEKTETPEYVYIIAFCSNKPLVLENNVSIFQSKEIANSMHRGFMNAVENSRSYKIGRFITAPLRWVKYSAKH